MQGSILPDLLPSHSPPPTLSFVLLITFHLLFTNDSLRRKDIPMQGRYAALYLFTQYTVPNKVIESFYSVKMYLTYFKVITAHFGKAI